VPERRDILVDALFSDGGSSVNDTILLPFGRGDISESSGLLLLGVTVATVAPRRSAGRGETTPLGTEG
jgi:hypothetical protein